MLARKMIIGMVVLVLLMMWGPTFGSTIYVNWESTHPSPDGSTWVKAYKYLQDALEAASSGDEIWVAEGTYYPDQNSTVPNGTDDRSDTFAIGTGVDLYGGFPPGGGNGQNNNWDMDDREPNAYETVLSGDINEPDDANDNSYHVVTGADEVLIDGFTISGGNAEDPAFCGGGIFSYGGWPPSTITLKKSVIKDNKADRYGAGMYNEYFAATIEDCFFADNTGGGTGGMFNQGADPTLINCVFSGNQATATGIGGRGGAIRGLSSSITLTNCTFSNNSAGNTCGGVYGNEDAVVTNCIFWGNTDSGGSDESAQLYVSGTATVTYSCIQGLDEFSGNGNIDDDPLFGDESLPGGYDGIYGTWDDGLQMVGTSSPCYETGSGGVDMGARQFTYDFPYPYYQYCGACDDCADYRWPLDKAPVYVQLKFENLEVCQDEPSPPSNTWIMKNREYPACEWDATVRDEEQRLILWGPHWWPVAESPDSQARFARTEWDPDYEQYYNYHYFDAEGQDDCAVEYNNEETSCNEASGINGDLTISWGPGVGWTQYMQQWPAWDSGVYYSSDLHNDKVHEGNKVWTCKTDNVNQRPSEDIWGDYWLMYAEP